MRSPGPSTSAMPQSTGSAASSRSPWSRSTAGKPWRMVWPWAESAPACLPAPMTSILTRPLSTSPWKSVCGLTRFDDDHAVGLGSVAGGPDRAAEGALADGDDVHGRDDSAPTLSSVTPRPSSTARCPAAVAPPWLPMQGTTKGSPPASRTAATAAREDGRQVVDPPAAGGDRDARAGPDGVAADRRAPALPRPPPPRPPSRSPGSSWSTSCRRGLVVPQTVLLDTADRIAVEPTTTPTTQRKRKHVLSRMRQ